MLCVLFDGSSVNSTYSTALCTVPSCFAGNLNPAVSFCLVLGKHISVVRALCYIVAQCVGAVIGSAIAKVVTNGRQFQSVYGGSNVITLGISEERAFLGEARHIDSLLQSITPLLCVYMLIVQCFQDMHRSVTVSS